MMNLRIIIPCSCRDDTDSWSFEKLLRGGPVHIAVVSIGALGHILPNLPFVRELTDRGVRVTYFYNRSLPKAH